MSLRIHFGAGGHNLPGWQNYDMDLDITKTPFAFADNSAEMCFASHVLEHTSGPDALRFLTECNRILIPGGKVRIVCPIVGPWLQREHARDLCLGHGHLILLNEDIMRTLLWMAGFAIDRIRRTDLSAETDHHQRTIGVEKDAIESCRMEAVK